MRKLLVLIASVIFASAGVIKIGAIVSATGPASFLGDPELKTLQYYVDKINKNGGVNGDKIKLIAYDTGANPKREKNPYDRLYKDETGRLVLEYIRIVGDLQPKIFVMENVPGIKEVRGEIIKEFREIGYEDVYFNTLRAEDYGNPSVEEEFLFQI